MPSTFSSPVEEAGFLVTFLLFGSFFVEAELQPPQVSKEVVEVLASLTTRMRHLNPLYLLGQRLAMPS